MYLYGDHPALDACAHAAEYAKNNNSIVPFKYAKGCYELFAFNPEIRDDTIDSVKATLESFYVFHDIAKAPPLLEHSDLKPVDLAYELEQLKYKTYKSDYAFHADLSRVIARLQDPHTTYRSMCYHQFVFVQPLSTYGVYENGKQRVKVASILPKLDPRLTSDLLDCEVTHIDGKPAFEVMVDFARTKAYSKDRSVRLNKVFANLVHDRTGSYFDRYTLGAFAQRTHIPHNATVTYTIDCSAKHTSSATKAWDEDSSMEEPPQPQTFDLEWSALDATTRPYNSAKTFRNQFCTFDGSKTTKKFVLDNAVADDFHSGHGLRHDIRLKSRELYRGPYASFHMLQDGETAVFRLATEEPNKDDKDHRMFYSNIDDGLEIIKDAGATKLIIDLQNNSGGIICWGRYVLQVLFPQTVESPYIYNLRASPLAQALAISTFNYKGDEVSPYEGLIDPLTGDEVQGADWIVPGVTLANRTGLFSHRVTDRYCSRAARLRESDAEVPFEAKDIVLLTNGYCGSTCAVLALQLKERYNVKTVAIGGHHDESMMFTSFPGGAVQANNTLWTERVHQLYAALPQEMRTPEMNARVPKYIPANGQLAFTFREVMSASQPDMVSEYMRIPSDYRMDYTTSRFRLPSILWEDVRQLVWGDANTPLVAVAMEEAIEEEDEQEYSESSVLDDDEVQLLDTGLGEGDKEKLDQEFREEQEQSEEEGLLMPSGALAIEVVPGEFITWGESELLDEESKIEFQDVASDSL
ncbi:hypothetical protein BGW42_007952 [Actinomortierella wolfii]|nr:hypothetical protein BGW42_007952 [Actinomortierella wolfii]